MKLFLYTKRIFDIVFSLFVLFTSLPLLLVIAILVSFSSKGPIIYKCKRVGQYGKIFKLYKFRSMIFDHEADETITIYSDKRITKVGYLLRKTKLDEFPQFINILLGDMTIVGPRPESETIVKEFYSVNDKKEILSIKPGLTSPGTLMAYIYHERLIPPENLTKEIFYAKYLLPLKLLADRHYLHYRNPSYDINLFFQTIYIIFKKNFSLTINWEPLFYKQNPKNWKDPRF